MNACNTRAGALSRLAAIFSLFLSALPAVQAQGTTTGWEAGGVIDLSASTRQPALAARDRGLSLGHSDISVRGPLGPHLQAQATAALHMHERRLEADLEEAWAETRTLPGGMQVRLGRFASQIGYLNEQHPHADDFVERPLLYRTFFGNHWTDDGIRINWVAPTPWYLRVGAEVFRGKRLVEEAVAAQRPGAIVLSMKTGADLNESHSWQAGLSFLHNRREAAVHDEEEEHEHGPHGALLSGRRMWLGDLAWKWAPGGDNARQQVRVVYERARTSGLNRFARPSDRQVANYLSVVWRFAPQWETGVRTDALRARVPHGDHFHRGRLKETALMLAWKPTHTQTLRVQYTRQRDAREFTATSSAVQLQYVLQFGAHPAHAF